jgi:DNA polymerase-3 subunit delta
MSWTDFRRAVEGGRLAPVLVFYGPEAALRARAVEMVREAAPDASVVRFEGDLSKLHEELFTGSLFAERKIVIAEPEPFPVEWIERYSESCAEGTLLVIFSNEKRPPLKPRPGILLVSCTAPKDTELAGEIEREISRRGKRIDPRTADHFARRLGGSYSRFESEVEKLIGFIGGRPNVTLEDIDALIHDEQSFRGFDLVDRIVANQPAEALRILHRLIEQGEPIPVIMGSLAWQIRKMVQVKRGLKAGMSGPEACDAAGIRWKKAEFARRVGRIEESILVACHDRLLKADASLKTGGGSEEALLDGLVLRLSQSLSGTV